MNTFKKIPKTNPSQKKKQKQKKPKILNITAVFQQTNLCKNISSEMGIILSSQNLGFPFLVFVLATSSVG